MTLRSLVSSIALSVALCLALALPAGMAADERSPYGGGREGNYGGRHNVETVDEARQVLRDYFGKRNVRIGEVREKEIYFEADILDRKGEVVDTVIVNKRTGRIRSIY